MTTSWTLPRRFGLAAIAVAGLVGTVACSSASNGPLASSPAATPRTSPTPSASTGPPARDETSVGTIVRFTSDRTSVDVRIGDESPVVRDFLAMLPLEITVEEFAGREKIAFLPRQLDHEGSPGSDPEDGDLIYYIPWGNLGFYYDASGIGYSDATLHLGTYDASRTQLALLEGEGVRVDIVD